MDSKDTFNPDFSKREPILPPEKRDNAKPLMSKEDFAKLDRKKKVEILGLI